jgi:aminopeptidase
MNNTLKVTAPYVPPKRYLERYADVLINFALNNGKGIKKGEVARISCPEAAKPLYYELCKKVYQSGGHVLHAYRPDDLEYNFSKLFFEEASHDQITFFPKSYMNALAETIDHRIAILAETDKKSLEGVDSKKMMKRGEAMKPFADMLVQKEAEGNHSWTLGLYGTEGEAKEAGMSLEQYWKQIIKACFLDKKDPVAEFKNVNKEIEKNIKKLNSLDIERVHVEGEDTDLWITIGKDRQWLGGRGNNIPSFEIFTSPDWRGTNGHITFDLPLYRYGVLIEGIELEFENGKVKRATAKKNQKVLQDMIATKDADKVGEFSLTDKRHSRINTFMAETLYDENYGGKYGNTHIALGRAYKDAFTGDQMQTSKDQWNELGFNDSSVHSDIIQTSDRVVTAHLKNGNKRVIYEGGSFTF